MRGQLHRKTASPFVNKRTSFCLRIAPHIESDLHLGRDRAGTALHKERAIGTRVVRTCARCGNLDFDAAMAGLRLEKSEPHTPCVGLTSAVCKHSGRLPGNRSVRNLAGLPTRSGILLNGHPILAALAKSVLALSPQGVILASPARSSVRVQRGKVSPALAPPN